MLHTPPHIGVCICVALHHNKSPYSNRVKISAFPRPREPVSDTTMAQLADLLSSNSFAEKKGADLQGAINDVISGIKAALPDQTDAELYAPNLLPFQRAEIAQLAADHKAKLSVSFWQELEKLSHTRENVIVCVYGKRATIEHRVSDVTFAKHIGMMLKRGVAMYFVNSAKAITWDNWKNVYAALTYQPDTHTYDIAPSQSEVGAILKQRETDRNFSQAARVTGRRSLPTMQECFYQKVRCKEIKRQDRATLRREDYRSAVVSEAKRILAVL